MNITRKNALTIVEADQKGFNPMFGAEAAQFLATGQKRPGIGIAFANEASTCKDYLQVAKSSA